MKSSKLPKRGSTVVLPSDFQSARPDVTNNQQVSTSNLRGCAPAPAPAPAPTRLYVLVACEESQAITSAFRKLGHVAYSCDLQPVRPHGNPYWHIQGDVTPLLDGDTAFNVQAGYLRFVPRWDLIIAHPPCTYLCKVSSIHMVINGILQQERYQQMLQAREFFMKCLAANAPYVAVENPLPMERAQLPKPSCFIQPWWFGVKYSKKTLWWLKNLPPLMPTVSNPYHRQFVRASRGKYRARTFPEVAAAIARQWSEHILSDYRQQKLINNPDGYRTKL